MKGKLNEKQSDIKDKILREWLDVFVRNIKENKNEFIANGDALALSCLIIFTRELLTITLLGIENAAQAELLVHRYVNGVLTELMHRMDELNATRGTEH
jgi:hypothetical protein